MGNLNNLFMAVRFLNPISLSTKVYVIFQSNLMKLMGKLIHAEYIDL